MYGLMNCRLPMVSLFILAAALSLSSSASAQSPDDAIPKAQLVERVVCQSDVNQSYALYVPSGYTHDKHWPILYCFDFVGNGKVAVLQFRAAAERYGYIVAGSNNSKNGVVENSVAAFKAVWSDTHARFSINNERVYTAGFSGGARIASLIASFYHVEGVVACGAGFQIGLFPDKKTVFSFFATVGTDDFNFPEMTSLEKSLNKQGVINRLVEFEGWHTWAPVELCFQALGWMEIQAMKRNKRERDEALIDTLYSQWMERAEEFARKGRPYEAYLRLKSQAADFKGLRDVSALEKRVALLKESEPVKRGVRQEADQARKQKELEDEIWSYTDRIDDPDGQVTAIGRLKERIAQLRKDFESPEPTDQRRVVRRALTHLFEVFYERATVKYVNNHTLAIRYLEIAVEINPNDARASYRLACRYAMKGEKKKALAALKSAAEKGFANLTQLDSNEELNSIRGEAEFRTIVDRIRLSH